MGAETWLKSWGTARLHLPVHNLLSSFVELMVISMVSAKIASHQVQLAYNLHTETDVTHMEVIGSSHY